MLWLTHTFDMCRWFQSFSKLPTVIWGKWHVNWNVKKWRIKSRFQYASVYLSCRASSWDDLLVLHAKPLVPDKRTNVNVLPCCHREIFLDMFLGGWCPWSVHNKYPLLQKKQTLCTMKQFYNHNELPFIGLVLCINHLSFQFPKSKIYTSNPNFTPEDFSDTQPIVIKKNCSKSDLCLFYTTPVFTFG